MPTPKTVIFCPQCDQRECLVVSSPFSSRYTVSCASCGYSGDGLSRYMVPQHDSLEGGSMPSVRPHSILRNEGNLAKAS